MLNKKPIIKNNFLQFKIPITQNSGISVGISSSVAQGVSISQSYSHSQGISNSATCGYSIGQSVIRNSKGQYNPNSLFTNGELSGTLCGIMETHKMQQKIIILPDKEYISVPQKDIQYEFYVKVPIIDTGYVKYTNYKITPFVREHIINGKINEVSYCSELSIETLDDVPMDDNFTFFPKSKIDFKLFNNRTSIDDNIYKFHLNGIEILSLFYDQENGFLINELEKMLHLFDFNNGVNDLFSDAYSQYILKTQKKLRNKSISLETPFTTAICVSSYDSEGLGALCVNPYEDGIATKEKIYIVYDKKKQGSNIGNNIRLFSQPLISTNEKKHAGKIVEIFHGETLDKKEFRKVLIVGGDIVAIDKFK